MTSEQPHGAVPPVPLPPPGVAVPSSQPVSTAPPVSPAAPAPSAPQSYAAQPDPYYGQPAPAAQHPYAPVPPSGLSVASMVTGIVSVVLGWFGFGFLLALAAVITGHLAQKRQPWAKGFWLTGLITGYVGLATSVMVIAISVIPFLFILIFAGVTAGTTS
ncbi:MAG: DUF4190 domain-containing protein [Rhodoglobus sp.]